MKAEKVNTERELLPHTHTVTSLLDVLNLLAAEEVHFYHFLYGVDKLHVSRV